MARKSKDEQNEIAADEAAQQEENEMLGPIAPENAVLKLMRSLKKHQAVIDEAKGNMGEAVNSAVERDNIHKDALRVVKKYANKNKNPAQQAAFIQHLDAYWTYLQLARPTDDMFSAEEKKADKPKGSRKRKGAEAEASEGATMQAATETEGNVTRLSRGGLIRDGKVIPASEIDREHGITG